MKAGLRPRVALHYTLWELRGSVGRVVYWLLCLGIGVAAVVGIDGLAASLDQAIRAEAKSLLAADIKVRSGGPLPQRVGEAIDAIPGSRRVDLHGMITLVARGSGVERPASGPASLLVELRAIDGPFPFYGEVEMELPGPGGALAPATSLDRPLSSVLTEDNVLVGSQLLERLALGPGDPLRVGRRELTIAGVILAEPDRFPGALTVGPSLLLSQEAFAGTGLADLGNFVRRRTLVAMGPGSDTVALERATESLRAAIGDDPTLRLETYRDAQPMLRRGLERLESYLGLVALLSLLIGGVGVAQGVRTWISSRLDALAVLKCLGARPREVFALCFFQVLVLGLIGSAIGGLFGLASLMLVPLLLAGLVPPEAIDPWQPLAYLKGVSLGVGVATAFGLPPLIGVLRVPPARVFRRTAEPLPGSVWLPAAVAGALVVAIGLTAALQARSLVLAAQFVGGVFATAAALLLGSWLAVRGASSLRRDRQAFWIRNGLAALGRPGSGTLGAIAALGLGLLVLLTMTLVQGHLEDQLRADLPSDAPTAFLIEIRRDQWPEIERILVANGAERIDSAPVVLARIDSVDGVPAAEVARETGERWIFSRDIRMTYLDQLPDDNELVEGALWGDPELAEVSVEEGFASELGIGLGSEVEISVRGESYRLAVTSLRRVDWEGFGINFFFVVEPGVLDQAPQTRLAATRLPSESEQETQDQIAASFPNVTMFQIRQLLDRVVGMLERLQLGVRVLGGFTVLAGLAILAGAVATTSARRGREAALLKTLGMTRFDVARTFATEFALAGMVAGTVGCLGAVGLSWFVVTQQMEMDWSWRIADLITMMIGGPLLSVGVGLLATTRALSRPPADVLREG